MNLVISVFGSTMGLVWTPYETEDGSYIPPQYLIYKGSSPDNMQLLTTVTGSQTSYNDINVFDLNYYMIGVERACNVSPAYSNKRSNGFVGIPEENKIVVNIFPNPTSKEIHLSIESENFEVEILDIVGQVLIREKSKTTIDIQTLNAGTYIVKVKMGKVEFQQQIIVY